jgi:multiple sugar transport system permease protein
MMNQPTLRRAIIYAALLSIGLVQILPFVWALATSVKPLDDAYRFPPTLGVEDPQWSNYADAFEKLPFARFMVNSAVISIAAVTGAVLTSSMAGYALARLPMRGKRFWFVLLVGSMMLPSQVLLIPHFLTYEMLGWVGTYKPLIVPAWLGGGAFNVFLFRQFFKSIPPDTEEAALLDGATRWQFYRHVLMPMSTPAVITVAVLSFIYHWQSFLNPLIYLSDFRTYPVSVGLRMYQTMAGTWINLLMAASLISIIPMLIVFAIGQRHLATGLIAGRRD